MTKNKANKELHKIGLKYWDSIPTNEIQSILDQAGFGIDLETNDRVMDGIYCGREGQTSAKVGKNNFFNMSWYQMDVTKKYEIVAYVS